MNLGRAIKEIRISKGLLQMELAEKVGISRKSMSQIETNFNKPSKQTMAAICKVLDTPESFIVLSGLEEADVAEGKKEAYNILMPAIKELVKALG